MLEHYFTKPDTIGRIKESWIGESIEKYVVWLSSQGYAARTVHKSFITDIGRSLGKWAMRELCCVLGVFLRYLYQHREKSKDRKASEFQQNGMFVKYFDIKQFRLLCSIVVIGNHGQLPIGRSNLKNQNRSPPCAYSICCVSFQILTHELSVDVACDYETSLIEQNTTARKSVLGFKPMKIKPLQEKISLRASMVCEGSGLTV